MDHNSSLPAVVHQQLLPPMNGAQPGYAMPVEIAKRTLTPTLVLNALKRWWLPATAASLVLVACSAAVTWFTFQPTYRAAAWLQIRENPTHLAYPTHDNAERFVQNQIELLHSSLVIGPALANPEVAKIPELQQQTDPINWLSRRVRVAGIGNSELFEVSYDSAEPEASATLVNAVVESYLALRNEHDTTHNDRMLELLEEEKQLRSQEVARMREHVRELSKQLHGRDPYTGNPSGDIVLLKHPLDDLMNRLTASQVDRKMQEVQLSALTEMSQGAAREVPAAVIDGAVEQRPEIIELKALLSNKLAMRDRVAETSAKGEQDSAYHRVARDVARLEQQLQRTRGSLRETVKAEVAAEAKIRQGDEVTAMQRALATTTVTEKALREQYQERLKAASQTGDQSLDLEFARAELAREEKVFELIAERAVALRTETRAPARVTLMKSAVVPTQPLESMPLKRMLLAIAMSIGAPFGLALVWEYYVRRINDAQQLNQDAHLSVVGEVAHLPKHGGNLYAHHDTLHDLSLFEESVDSLRTCLVLDDQHRDVRVIAVTSAVSGEGKTSVAAQLAVSIARATGSKTLLIDGDLRAPDIHRVFQIPDSPGLANLLEHKCGLSEAINTQWNEFVHVIPAGRINSNPHTLLNNGALRQLIDEAKREYAYIVIDTPPVLLASEALVIAKEVDGTLLCTMVNHSRESQVKAATERLKTVGARNLGAVLNGIPSRSYSSRYGSYPYARSHT